MKVLHISTGQDGAGLCAERIHRSLIKEGVDSRMLVYSMPKTIDPTIDAPYSKKNVLYIFIRAIRKIARFCNIALCEGDKFVLDSKKYNAFYSTPQTSLDITGHKWIQWADIINLHWCNNFFDQPLFFEKIQDKPIVWTIHDENIFYGTAHYHDAILDDDELEKKYYQIKHGMVRNAKNLTIVFLSQYFIRTFSNDSILEGKRVEVINNSVDISKYRIYDKFESRKNLGLSSDKKIILFVATSITDRHKGLNLLIDALNLINDDCYQIVAIGGNENFCGESHVLSVGKVYDPATLSQYYSAADVYALPSMQEAFSQSIIEALSCGSPVVSFPVGVAIDCINSENGYLCKDYSILELSKGVKHVMSNNYDRYRIRKQIEGKYSSEFIAKKYLNLYRELLKK